MSYHDEARLLRREGVTKSFDTRGSGTINFLPANNEYEFSTHKPTPSHLLDSTYTCFSDPAFGFGLTSQGLPT